MTFSKISHLVYKNKEKRSIARNSIHVTAQYSDYSTDYSTEHTFQNKTLNIHSKKKATKIAPKVAKTLGICLAVMCKVKDFSLVSFYGLSKVKMR